MQYFLNNYLFGGGAYPLNLYYCETEEEALKVYKHAIKKNLAHTFYCKLELVGVVGENVKVIDTTDFEVLK